MKDTRTVARNIRKSLVRMHRKGTGIGSSLSIADILAVLYFRILRIPTPQAADRDRFILSKGHAASALYATLAEKGFLDPVQLEGYLRDGSALTAHPCTGLVPGVDATTGSLGHGLPLAIGLAHAAKKDQAGFRVFVLMGCGEMQEGSVWEGAMLASQLKLDNLVAVIDANKLQGYGRTDTVQPIETLAPKLSAFGWAVREVDGHNHDELAQGFDSIPFQSGKPSAIIANTLKGKGIAEMEDQLGWHYFSVPEEKLESFLAELDQEGT